MLFDLQSPGRRVVVKVVYSALAILMGAGLVLFGIGGSGSGIFDSLGIGGGSSSDAPFQAEIDDANDTLSQNPRNQQALVDLITLQAQQAGTQVDDQGVPTSDGLDGYNRAADAWDRYLKLDTKQPDDAAALQMANAFFTLALTSSSAADAQAQIGNAADTQKVVADERPTSANLTRLAYFLYLAGRAGEANAAKQEAIAKGGPNAAKSVNGQLAQAEKQGQQISEQVKKEAKSASQTGANPLQPSTGGLGGDTGSGALSTP
ncbi:MAG: hypothetical protein EXQ70_05690 [Solirubrobacterales bacterium]|nr:hypothetical protein [Solirubrobacterales bacterium]